MLARRRQRIARDSETTIDDETLEKAMAFLKQRLEPEEMSELRQILKGEHEDEQASDEPPGRETPELIGKRSGNAIGQRANDTPPPFKGMPRTGGTMVASDSRSQSYAERWPDAARIGIGY